MANVDPDKVEKWGRAKNGSRISQDAVDYMSRAAREMVADELSYLLESGATATQAVDIWATEVAGVGVGTWADARGRDPHAIAQSIEKGRRNIVARTNGDTNA